MSKRKKYKKIVIGIDQSYTGTGISIGADGKLQKVSSTHFKGLESKCEKRLELRSILYRLLKKASQMASEVVILCERIRTFNAGGKGKNIGKISPKYLIATGALIGMIVDVAAEFDVNVYSVDTRSWKSKVVGNWRAKQKDGKRDAKSETVDFIQEMGFNLYIRDISRGKNKGTPIYDDDAADSACICLYGFLPKNKQTLQLEN